MYNGYNEYISDNLKERLKIKNDCLELICDIAVDYDGYRDVKSLMQLIDELRAIASYGRTLSE